MNSQEEQSTKLKLVAVPRKSIAQRVGGKESIFSPGQEKPKSRLGSMIRKFESLQSPGAPEKWLFKLSKVTCKTKTEDLSSSRVKSLVLHFEYLTKEAKSISPEQPKVYLHNNRPPLRYTATKKGFVSNGTFLKYVATNTSVTSFSVTTSTSVTSSGEKERLERCMNRTEDLLWMSKKYYDEGKYGPPIDLTAEKSSNPKIDKSIVINPNICQEIKDSLTAVLKTVEWYGPLLDKVAKDVQMRRVRKDHRGVTKLLKQLIEEVTNEHPSIDDKEEPTYTMKDDLFRAETLATVYKLAKDLLQVLERVNECLEN